MEAVALWEIITRSLKLEVESSHRVFVCAVNLKVHVLETNGQLKTVDYIVVRDHTKLSTAKLLI